MPSPVLVVLVVVEMGAMDDSVLLFLGCCQIGAWFSRDSRWQWGGWHWWQVTTETIFDIQSRVRMTGMMDRMGATATRWCNPDRSRRCGMSGGGCDRFDRVRCTEWCGR